MFGFKKKDPICGMKQEKGKKVKVIILDEKTIDEIVTSRKIDFDIVVTTLGNALWTTHEDGRYVFDGDVIRLRKLAELFPSSFSINDDLETFKDKAFSFLLFAQSNKLTANHVNGGL